jgi:hypothetical protein
MRQPAGPTAGWPEHIGTLGEHPGRIPRPPPLAGTRDEGQQAPGTTPVTLTPKLRNTGGVIAPQTAIKSGAGQAVLLVMGVVALWGHTDSMRREHRHSVWTALTAPVRWIADHVKRWRQRPPEAGVREPRRPKPTPPAGAIALAEPRVGLRRWIKLISRGDTDRR